MPHSLGLKQTILTALAKSRSVFRIEIRKVDRRNRAFNRG